MALEAVDSWHLAEALYQKMAQLPAHPLLEFYWQVNPVAGDQKYGLKTYQELLAVSEKWRGLPPLNNLRWIGLMVMSSLQNEDFQQGAQRTFQETKSWALRLAADLSLPPLKLSMGMTSDYQTALQVGTDQVRLGSAIFQEDHSLDESGAKT